MIGRGLAKRLGRFRRRMSPRSPVILAYHRVFESEHDHWALNTPPDTFAEQIEALISVRRVLPLSELLERAREGNTEDEPLAAVTLDDGYHDNYALARPILERLGCPATVFVAAGLVGAEFWWDELALILIETPTLPVTLELTIGGKPHVWDLPAGDAEARRKACSQVQKRLLTLSPEGVEAQMAALRDWARVDVSARRSHRVMTSCELAKLRGGPLAIGAHTVNHPSLPALSACAQRAEIDESRRSLEAITGHPISDFAYPYGHYDGSSVASVRQSAIASACTIVPSIVNRGCDQLRLPRISPAGERRKPAAPGRLSYVARRRLGGCLTPTPIAAIGRLQNGESHGDSRRAHLRRCFA